jgi:hypothetical protein
LIQCVKLAGKDTKVERAGVMTYVMRVMPISLGRPQGNDKNFPLIQWPPI